MTNKQLYLLILPLLFFTFACKTDHPLDKKEAVNSLKILNGDLINFAVNTSQKPWYRAMKFLLNQSSSPLPFKNDTSGNFFNSLRYSFADKKGFYVWDTVSGTFVKQKDTSMILIYFPLPGKMESYCKFFLYAYEMQDTRSRPGFPIDIRAKLFIDNHEELSLNHHALIAENLLSVVSSDLHCSDFHLSFHMAREGDFSQKSGLVKGDLQLRDGKQEIISAEYNIDIDYHPPVTYSFQYIRLMMKVFESKLECNINYGTISPTSNEYANEFNKNSGILIKNLENSGIIGNVVLAPEDGKDKLDFFIRYSDGTMSKLSDQIIILKKILNKKYS